MAAALKPQRTRPGNFWAWSIRQKPDRAASSGNMTIQRSIKMELDQIKRDPRFKMLTAMVERELERERPGKRCRTRADLKTMKDFYDTRSKLVHGSALKPERHQCLRQVDDLRSLAFRQFLTKTSHPQPTIWYVLNVTCAAFGSPRGLVCCCKT